MELRRGRGAALWIVGGVVGVIGLCEVALVAYYSVDTSISTLVGGAITVLFVALAVALACQMPGAAVALAWGSLAAQIAFMSGFLWVQAAMALVVYFAARVGKPNERWAALFSVPAGTLLFAQFVMTQSSGSLRVLRVLSGVTGTHSTMAAGIVVALVLGIAWLLGFAAREQEEARVSEVARRQAEEERSLAQEQSEQADEIARLMEAQASLARDVHDVVGHSLAVILAQAESVAYMTDSDGDRVKDTVANIAAAARNSLQEVREVLGSAEPTGVSSSRLDLWALVDSIRSSGRELIVEEHGTPRDLGSTATMVRYRVTQELLTNALRHGKADAPIRLRHTWDEALTVEVSNAFDPACGWNPGGRGIEGIKQRLTRVHGTIEISRTDSGAASVFLARCVIRAPGGAV
jgi:signal transduction histidine kinase